MNSNLLDAHGVFLNTLSSQFFELLNGDFKIRTDNLVAVSFSFVTDYGLELKIIFGKGKKDFSPLFCEVFFGDC